MHYTWGHTWGHRVRRFQRVRVRNAAFQQRLGRWPGGLALLRLAGFADAQEGGEAVLRLRRHDPGLLWLVLEAVRGAREQAAQQLQA